ncbi:enoyl-CoA hydratase/isomerase family protein [Lentzea tibetensis]|uniref:Enoyl-CoA hydratase/isomerase family protein n=2 Tax=Lentzea tibetensis TaxID=2591470 RepID=A0A563F3N2_9PSEU|nr:enoyl-CoA hydratase/isomerase family protein [Lentzea tibetensis]
MESSPLAVSEWSDGYWRVTFDNPPINLVDPETIVALSALLDRLEADPAVKVVVFDSADEDFFLAHFDVARADRLPREPGPTGLPILADLATRLTAARFVTIAEIRGRARGLGSEFALALDMRFASRERAVFGQPEIGLGLIPGGGATEALPALVGRSRALEIVLGGDDFDADTAQQYGWINRALPDAELATFVDRLARRIASFDQDALVTAKELVTERAGVPSGEQRVEALVAFREASARPGTQQRVRDALEQGLQQRGDFELDLGARIGPAV